MLRHCIRLLLAACLLGAAATSTAASTPRIVAYTTGWNTSENAQLDKINTLIFAFAHISNGRVVLDPAAAATLDRITSLKAEHPPLQVVISVGGWGAGGFSEAAATATGRRAFGDSAAQLIVAHHADGLDVDWEYPGHHESGIASSPQDRAHFTLLLKALRASLDRAGARHAPAMIVTP